MKTWHIRIKNRVYEVTVAALDTNPISVTVDGEAFEVWVENDQLEARTGFQIGSAVGAQAGGRKLADPAIGDPESARAAPSPQENLNNGNQFQVLAPIPGVITDVYVQPGQSVQPGELLCSLEAMKMKNAIRSARNGVIAQINVNIGQHVRHQEVLMEFDRQEA